MSRCVFVVLLCAFVACQAGRQVATENPPPSSTAAAPQPVTPAPPPTEEQELYFKDIFTEDKALAYQGYEVEIRKKTIIDRDYYDKPFEVSYAVVKRGGKTVGAFAGTYTGLGNETAVGLFNFLGGEAKQLAISQTVSRGGRHWLVRLTPRYKVLFDSADYEVGREWVKITDMDRDGVAEIGLATVSFYTGFDYPMSMTPLPWGVFRYDSQTDSYLPANHDFQDVLLKDIEQRISKLPASGDKHNYLATRLDILLDYLYAGRERDGWEFFERAYDQPDKAKVKATVKNVLRKNRAYQYINRQARQSAK